MPETWIIICIYLQLFLHCFGNPCGNPITDAVNDIQKLVGNLPNDYIMKLKYVPKKESLPKHCWLYMMVVEMTRHLDNLLTKFENTSQNFLIIKNLSLILQGIRICIRHDEMDFDSVSSLYQVEGFKPRDFFGYVTSTIEVFKEINNTEYAGPCTMPAEYDFDYDIEAFQTPSTNHDLPYIPSTRKNSSRFDSSARSGFNTGASIQYSTVLIALACLVIGFLLGVLFWWKFKHRQNQTQDSLSAVAVEPSAENESQYILQQATTDVGVI
ncbi:KIT ligand L homeolog isoform X1 [Xenopus laevis]|uniref:Kit ligand n=1 Tax=Xenopus laevis TaxID=8355 RepID=A0A8J0UMZ5_XENLA|nr:KIT ligand L homeolog isoform X1 [Xenopus laevis]